MLVNPSDENRSIVDRYLRAWLCQATGSSGNRSWTDTLVCPEYIDYGFNAAANRPRSSARGPAALPGLTSLASALSDYRVSIAPVGSERDLVAAHIAIRGRHSSSPLLGVQATGTIIVCEATLICRLKDGRLYEQWGGFDTLGLAGQLGLAQLCDSQSPGHRRQLEMAATPREAARYYWETCFNERHLQHLDAAETCLLAVFPDGRVRVDDVFAEGDLVCSRISARGTHRGAWLGAPPTGKMISFEGVFIWRLADGQLAQRWGGLDRWWMAQQLDIVSRSLSVLEA